MDHILFTICITLLGTIIGSFLNVVIYRLPRGESFVFPASHCTSCGTDIRWYDNVPVFSYLILGRRCRTCGVKISPVYPIVEVCTGVSAGILAFRYGISMQMVSAFILSAILIVVCVIDIRYMIIPDKINIFGAVSGFLLSFRGGKLLLYRNISGALLGLFLLLSMYYLGKVIFKREGVGLGDVKLAVVMGLFIGPLWVFISVLIAVLIGGLWGIFQIILGKKRFGQEVPFGPFLAVGGFFILFFYQEMIYLINKYLSFF